MLRLLPIFFITLLLSLNYGAVIYINSTFLGEFFTSGGVTALFLSSYALNIGFFLITPKLLKHFGKERLFLTFLLICILGIGGLSFSSVPWIIGAAFIAYQGFLFLVYWCIDIFLEENTPDQYTGELRGIHYTFINVGVASGAFLVTLVSDGISLRPVYWMSLTMFIIPLIFAIQRFGQRKAEVVVTEKLELPFRKWWGNRSIRAISLSRLTLEIFYGIMIIYTPLYLHGELGFNWQELGFIFSIALLPFIFLEWPAGEMADRFWGEKEMLAIGLFITGVTLLVMPFLGSVFLSWLMILFLSRVGASLVEIMTETYFFKKIDATNTDFLSIFRLMRPTGLIIGAGVGALVIHLVSYPAIFFALAIIVFLGLRESLYIKDTL